MPTRLEDVLKRRRLINKHRQRITQCRDELDNLKQLCWIVDLAVCSRKLPEEAQNIAIVVQMLQDRLNDLEAELRDIQSLLK